MEALEVTVTLACNLGCLNTVLVENMSLKKKKRALLKSMWSMTYFYPREEKKIMFWPVVAIAYPSGNAYFATCLPQE